MDFSLGSVDLDNLILLERTKIWNDKKKLRVGLGLGQDLDESSDVSSDVPCQPVFDSNCNQISCVEEGNLFGSHQRENNRTPTSPSTSASEPRMRTMVRHGEYSPLNPNFLSPGKFMLGLGEYEERRRLLMIQKKHEYKEYLTQVRLLVNSRNGSPSPTLLGPSETKQNPQRLLNEDKYMEMYNKGMQVSEDTVGHQHVPITDTVTISTQHKGIQTPTEPFLQEYSQNVNSDAELKLNTQDTAQDVNSTSILHQVGTSSSSPLENWTPRERKMADLQVSAQLSKMFFDTSQQTTNPAHISTTDFEARRQSHSAIYKEELRQQIEEKRKLEFELREREKKEEEAINRKVEEQQEKIRLEYLKEEKKKLEKQKQRLPVVCDLEEYPDQHQRRDIKKPHKVAMSRQTSNLEECYPNNFHKHPILLPETNAACSSSNDVQEIQPEPTFNNTNGNYVKNYFEHEESNSVKFAPTLPFRSKSFTVIDSTISNDNSSFKSPVDGDSNRLWRPTDRNVQMQSCKTCNLEDSLPIPLFRSKSPANLPEQISVTGSKRPSKATSNTIPDSSQAMKKLEAKWQVPAVEKNNITRTTHQVPGGSRQKNVLTQLGAFRRQLQLEQMQTTEGLKKVKPQRILK